MRIEPRNGFERIADLPVWVQVAVYTLLVLIMGWLDYLIGQGIVLSLFYLIPVAWAAWCSPRPIALYTVLLSLVTIFLFAEYASGLIYTNTFASIWRSITRFGFFGITSTLIMRLRATQEQLRWLSSVDTLTQAVNARVFVEQVTGEMARSRRYARPFAIAYIDLDNFKQVNDRYGHLEGDRILRLVSQQIRENIRTNDLFGRLGGDEFVLLFPETDLSAAQSAIARIQTQLSAAIQAEQIPVTFSVGVLVCVEPPPHQRC